MLDHRLRRWPNIVPVMGECFVFAVEAPDKRRGSLSSSRIAEQNGGISGGGGGGCDSRHDTGQCSAGHAGVSARAGHAGKCRAGLAVSSSPRLGIDVFVWTGKIDVFQHSGDWEQSRPPKVRKCP